MAFALAARRPLPHRHRGARPRCRDGPPQRAGRLPVDHPAQLYAALPHRRPGSANSPRRSSTPLQSPHVELVQEVPGTPWMAAPGNSVHHLGYFTDNLAETARVLESNGFTFEMTAEISGSEFGAVRLLRRRLRHPHRDRRPRAVSRLCRVPAVASPRRTPDGARHVADGAALQFRLAARRTTHAEQADRRPRSNWHSGASRGASPR